jgi:hypothetical protein
MLLTGQARVLVGSLIDLTANPGQNPSQRSVSPFNRGCWFRVSKQSKNSGAITEFGVGCEFSAVIKAGLLPPGHQAPRTVPLLPLEGTA